MCNVLLVAQLRIVVDFLIDGPQDITNAVHVGADVAQIGWLRDQRCVERLPWCPGDNPLVIRVMDHFYVCLCMWFGIRVARKRECRFVLYRVTACRSLAVRDDHVVVILIHDDLNYSMTTDTAPL